MPSTRKSDATERSARRGVIRLLEKELFCELRPSKIHGIGVFAIRAIPKGIDPLVSRFKSPEVFVSHRSVKKLPSSVLKLLQVFCFHDKKGYLLPSKGLNVVSMAVYLNHSKNPNLRMLKNGQFKALCNIKKNTELTMDYDDSFGEEHRF